MKNIKKYIILLICFIIIISILLILLLMQINSKKNENEIEMEIGSEYIAEVNKMYTVVKSKNDYFRVKKIVELFYNYIGKLNEEPERIIEYNVEGEEYTSDSLNLNEYNQKQRENYRKVLYGMLGLEYINQYNITIENVEEKLTNYYANDFIINNMYSADIEENIAAYFVQGSIVKQNNLEEFEFIIIIDFNNRAFSIYLDDYVEQQGWNNYKENSIVDIKITEVQNNLYNQTDYENIADNEIVEEYFEHYKKILKYKPETLFNLLNEEYRIKRFGNLENFKQYVSKNREELEKSNIVSYSKVMDNGETEYICLDQNDNYYIFQETAPMQYTVILDTYTIDLPEFVQKYEAASEEEKILMNIQKFFTAIEAQDYNYAYNKLDETFKTNNFPTLAEFENYVKNTFFENNSLAAGTAEKQNNIYVYEVTISDKTKQSTQSIKKTFVMQLKEGTDFVMSFSK